MASTIDKIKNDIIEAMNASQKQTSAYDTEAEVVRIDGNTAWVYIGGGVPETPVQLTINAQKGDKVQVRIANDGAWIMGNATAPPTDDTKAIRADTKATDATQKALRAEGKADEAQLSAKEAQIVADDALTNTNVLETSKVSIGGSGISNLEQVFAFSSVNGLVISGAGGVFKTAIDSTALTFYQGVTPVAWITNNQLHINQTVVVDQMDVGDEDHGQWSWKVHPVNGQNNLYLKWLG